MTHRKAPRTVLVDDRMQEGYRYECTAPVGIQFDPRFKPDFTPQEMLALGIFGGVYLRDCKDEFPRAWFAHAKLQKEGIREPDASLNYFGILASQPLSEWRRKGWIYTDDPRGWFQWYCRYYQGRRIPAEDDRQIKRWSAMRRHIGQIKAHCMPGDETCRPRQRQALLQWGYDSRRF